VETGAWTSVDDELDWPTELLRGELLALRDHPLRACTASEVKLLLEEAFHTEVPAKDYARITNPGTSPSDPGPGSQWVTNLLAHLHELRESTPPRPYWPARYTAPAPQPIYPVATAPQRFAELVGALEAAGYLDRDFGEPCAYGPPPDFIIDNPASVLEQRLGRPDLWPLQPENWDTDTFFGLIEVFHDLVARPRLWWFHDDCGDIHPGNFDTDAGRRVYRALVNRILDQTGVELRLAESGEDIGRLVHLADEGRTDLIQRALACPEPTVASRIRHAIALFRDRNASEHNKRSAIVALAGVLEERRPLLRDTLLRGDENALFQIANQFALRHHDAQQRTDYDPIFLDWVFWWYLATLELTDRLLTRRATQIPAETS